jgi:hypothetical protein
MAEIQHQSSDSPPKKHRDPALVERSKGELRQRREDYIGEIIKSSALESLRQGTMVPSSLKIGKEGKQKLSELKERLFIEQKVLLNMALAYAYTEAKQKQISTSDLRSRIEALQLDEEFISFELDESILNILFDAGIQDAQFVYLNAGLDLLYSRLIQPNAASMIWK